MCVCVRTRSIKSAIEFVCAHVKDIEWLAYWNVRWDMCSLSLWHGYLPAALDYRCVVGEEGGPINYRGTMAGICVEEERGLPHVLRRPSYVLREIGRHPYISEGREIVWDRERERERGEG